MNGCLLAAVSVLFPRLALLFICILTDWLDRAYESIIWPLLGFFFMPYTTLAYMAAILNNNGQIATGNNSWLVLLIIAIVIDVLGWQTSSKESE